MRPFAILPQSAVKRSGDRVGAKGVLKQVFVNDPMVTAVVVPDGASFVFAEAIGAGGAGRAGFGNFGLSGGAAGNDAILPIRPSDTVGLSVALSAMNTNPPAPTTVSVNGSVVLSAESSVYIVQGYGSGAVGKYPGGGPTLNPITGGKGGGRLAGRQKSGSFSNAGIGSGAATTSNDTTETGGIGAICLTFFETYNEAVDFAKAVYGGAWQP